MDENQVEKTMAEAMKKLGFSEGFPAFNEDSCQCLNCGRIILCGGPCCDKPVYCEPKDNYKNYSVSETEEDRVFCVESQSGSKYFVVMEDSGFLSNTMWQTKEQAVKSRDKKDIMKLK